MNKPNINPPIVFVEGRTEPFGGDNTPDSEEIDTLRKKLWERYKNNVEGEVNSKSETLPLKFVGFIELERQLYVSLPKVYRTYLERLELEELVKEDSPKFYAEVYRIIRNLYQFMTRFSKYIQRRDLNSLHFVNTFVATNHRSAIDSPKDSLIDLTWKIIDDYERNGLFETTVETFLETGNGEICWNRTLSSFTPIHTPNGPMYDQFIHYHTEEREDALIKKIHHYIVQESYRTYGGFHLNNNRRGIDFINRPTSDRKMLYEIRHEKERTFHDREIELLQLLERYLSIKQTHDEGVIQLFGTYSFEIVFEHACRRILEQRDIPIQDGYNHLNSTVSWNMKTKDKKTKTFENKGGQADIVLPFQISADSKHDINEEASTILVVDAKYYDIDSLIENSKDQSKLEGAPSITDVRKQYLYAKLLRSESSVTETRNALCFPILPSKNSLQYQWIEGDHALHDIFTDIGSVCFSELKDSEYPPISLFAVNLEWIFEHFDRSPKLCEIYKMLWNSSEESSVLSLEPSHATKKDDNKIRSES